VRQGAAALLLALLAAHPAAARTLLVGPGAPYPTPSAAAAAARAGDRVEIAAGHYVDCAVWRADRLVIAGAGTDATVITGPACDGKGLFVIAGRGVVVQDLALVGAHVPDGNGAGIRAEGVDLTVLRVRFEDDENGILSGSAPASTILVRDSVFLRNGRCTFACAHGIYAGRIKRLVVEHTRFLGTREGHHIKSRALRTEITGCDIADGLDGTASYLIDIPNGGTVTIADNRLEKGPRSQNAATAIMLGAEGVSNPTPAIRIHDNIFRDDGAPTVFVRNLTQTPAVLTNNVLQGPVTPLATNRRASFLMRN
jgi:hypothetical protein